MPAVTAEFSCQRSPIPSAEVSASLSVLADVFQTPFRIIQHDGTLLGETDEFASVHDVDSKLTTADHEVLDDLLGRGRTSAVRSLNPDRFRLFFRIGGSSTEPCVATGVIAANMSELIDRLAQASLRIISCGRDIQEQQAGLDAFAEQVSLNFEEITWLRSLTEQLEYCAVSNPIDQVSEQMLPSLREIVGAEALVLFLTRENAETEGDVAAATEIRVIRSGTSTLSDELCRRLVTQLTPHDSSKPKVKNHLHLCPEFAPYYPGVHSCIVAPVVHRTFQAGWLLALNRLQNRRSGPTTDADALQSWECEFGTEEASLISAAAAMLSTHARNAALFREKEALLVGVIRSLINAMDAKDSYTCGHSDRVALIARRLGEELALDHQECERLYMTGLLHDIGKIGVPDSVLLKPGKLTEEEFATIKRHPEIGHSILKHLTQLSYALPGVLYHHETFAGTGYPHQLRAEQIPLFGRILAVADAYDAMTSNRPYREAMPPAKAVEILQAGAGIQWDGKVVDAFMRAHREIGGICSESREHTQAILHRTSPSDETPANVQKDSLAEVVAVTNH